MAADSAGLAVAAPSNKASPGQHRQQRISLLPKIAYSSGALVDGVATNAVNVFLLFYLTVICGMPGAAAGIALSLGLIVDAVFDPLLGGVSDSWRSKLGRRLPFMIAGVIPAAGSFIAIFTVPRMLHGSALFFAVCGLSILLRISVSLFNLPYLALGAEITDDYKERSSVAAWRWGLGMSGLLACIAMGFGVFFTAPQGLMRAAAYAPFGVASALLVIGGGVIALIGTYVLRDHAHAPAERASIAQFLPDLTEVFRNPSFRLLFASAVLFFSGYALNQSVSLHSNTFFWRLTAGETQIVTLAIMGGLILGAPLVAPIVTRLEKRTSLFIGLGGMVVAQAGPVLLRLSGLLPLSHGGLVLFLSLVAAWGGVMLTLGGIAFTSMMADAADEHEMLFAKRREGLYFAGWAFAAKAAGGIGALVAGVALQLVGFPSDLAAKGGTHAVLAPGTVTSLGVIAGPCAAFLSLLGVMVLIWYRLDSEAHAAVMTTLADRRQTV